MKRLLLGVGVAASLALASEVSEEVWIGVGKIGGDVKTVTEYAIGYERMHELEGDMLLGYDASVKYARMKEKEEERTVKVDEWAFDLEGLYGMALSNEFHLLGVGGVRLGTVDGSTTIYGLGIGVEAQYFIEENWVVSADYMRHFMKNDNDLYYQTNTFMIKFGYEF